MRVDPGSYADARIYGSAVVTTKVTARVALENLFNRHYEEVYGFPALGRRLLLGLTVGR